MFSSPSWRCACRLRELNISRKAWGNCRARREIAVLAARLFHLTPLSVAENGLGFVKRPLTSSEAQTSTGYQRPPETIQPAPHKVEESQGNSETDTEQTASHTQLAKNVLKRLADDFSTREKIRQAAVEMGIPDIIYNKCLDGFKSSLSNPNYIAKHTHLQKLLSNISEGSAHLDDLFPYFMKYAREKYPALTVVPELQKISDLTCPHMWYPRARSFKRRFIFHAGPTNSGKTHNALEKFLSSQSGIYCAPLRMLAHEVYRRSNKRGIPCDLLTGEERQFASGSIEAPSNHMACTVEMADLNSYYDVGVVDEIQMIQDEERGGAWTRAVLGLPAQEIHLCGHESTIPLIRRLADNMGDEVEVCQYKRLSPLVPLEYSLDGEFKSVRPGDCMVVFSRAKIFHIRRKIEKATQEPCAVVYGGLPPVTRVQQAELFNEAGNRCQTMVATDAIGMGLNLNIRRIIFYDIRKFDGREYRPLTSSHVKQIAGRAGRYGLDHCEGEATTFFAHDLEKFHELLSSAEEDIKQAGIYPTYEQIEHFSHLLPRASFLDILTLFFKMAQLEGNFFLCDVQGQLDIAAELRDLKLSLKDMYRLTTAPAEKKHHLKVLKEYATDYSQGEKVTYSRLCEIVSWPQRSPLTTVQLGIFEQIHEAIDLYLWLCMRFPECFVAADEARELQRHIQDEIAHYIVKRSRPLSLVHKLRDGEGAEVTRRLNRRTSVRHRIQKLVRTMESKPNKKLKKRTH